MTTPSYRVSGPCDINCDVLIVGSGAGGSAVAHALGQSGRSVVMVEEGSYIPAASVPARASDAFLAQWRNAGLTAALGRPLVAYAEGRVVGGGTQINSAIIQRVPEDLLARWIRDWRIEGLTIEQMAALYDEVECLLHAAYTPPPLGRPSDILKQGSDKLGWRSQELKRAHVDCLGANNCSIGCPTGAKQAMATALLPEILGGGTRLITNCSVRKLVLQGGKVVVARAEAMDASGARCRVTFRPRQVFLCAGAIHTPALLLRSGLRRNIGRSLRLHPTVKCLGFFDEPVNAHKHRLPLYAVTEFMPDLRLGGSVFTPAFYGMNLGEDWAMRGQYLDRMENAASYYAMVRGQGTGRIHVLPLLREPIVTYDLAVSDRRLLGDGLDKLARLMFAAGARLVIPSISGHAGWDRPEQAGEFRAGLPAGANLMTIHLFSSCPMGEDADRTATDSYGRLHGVANLTVADASLIPEAPGVNPQATVMALARRAARAFLSGGGDAAGKA